MADSPCVPSGNPKFFPHRASVAVLSILLVGRSSCRLASVLGAPLADLSCVPSGNPKFFPHRATVAVLSVLLVGRSSGRLASVLGAPLADSPRFWAPLWPTRLAFRLETSSFFPTAPLSLFFRFCWLGAPLDHSLWFWAPLLPAVSCSLRKPQVFFPPHLCRCLFRFTWLGPPVANSPRFCLPLSPTRLVLPLETPSFFSGGLPSCELAWPCLWGTPGFSPHELCPRLFDFVLLDLAFRARGDVSDKMELPTGSTRRLA